MSAQCSRSWPPEQLDALRALWASGKSASVCAEQLGGRTRNAVIGMVHRLGLPKRQTRVVGRVSARPMACSKPKVPRPAQPARIAQPMVVYAPLPRTEAWKPLPGTQPVGLTDLGASMCRWPVTVDRPWLFCGAAADGVYCSAHKARSVMGVRP
jgi:GcrA cell cycle regulator